MPYVIDGDGNCHVYVDAAADLDMAVDIVVNAKTQRPSVCNAAETLLVHADVAAGVPAAGWPRSSTVSSWSATPPPAPCVDGMGPADATTTTPASSSTSSSRCGWSTASTRPSTTLDGTAPGHSEAIVTDDAEAAERFCREVDAAAVLVNASTRFVDGEELGLGAEIGISTQKLHARGPMGLRELTTLKYVVEGAGQIRT